MKYAHVVECRGAIFDGAGNFALFDVAQKAGGDFRSNPALWWLINYKDSRWADAGVDAELQRQGRKRDRERGRQALQHQVDRRAAVAAGCDGFIEKPISPRDLLFRIKPTVFDDIVSLIALFRPGNSTFYIRGQLTQQFGTTNDIPVPREHFQDVGLEFIRRRDEGDRRAYFVTNRGRGDSPRSAPSASVDTERYASSNVTAISPAVLAPSPPSMNINGRPISTCVRGSTP